MADTRNSVKSNNAIELIEEKPKAKMRKMMWKQMKKDWRLYALLILPLLNFLIFKYFPMYGITIAFKRFKPGGSLLSGEWAGLLYFKMLLKDSSFWQVFKNTFILSISALVIGFPIPIIFALLLNEIKNSASKRIVQTITYLPRFLSTVVVVSMIFNLLSPSTGIVNTALESLGIIEEPIFFMNQANLFRPIYIASDIWQFMGWNAILYIAALSGVDEALYEAASIDGANRWQQTVHITIPGIMPTIIVTLILAMGNTLNIGFEKVLLMYNPNIYETADVLQTYIYRLGLASTIPRFSSATAAGLFQSVVSLVMLFSANYIARTKTDYSLY